MSCGEGKHYRGPLTLSPDDKRRSYFGAIHPKAMPVILTEPEEIPTWMTAPWEQARALQRPLRDGALTIVARGGKKDGVPEDA